MHLFLTFSAALGIARTRSALHSLARKLHSLARKSAAARHSPIKQVCRSCSRLAKRATILFVFNRRFLALPNALQFYYYTLCESRHFLWNYAEIIAISDKTGRKRRAIEVECSRHYAIHPYCRAAFHTEYVVFHGFYQDIYILYNVYPAVFDKNQLSYKKNKEKAFLLWEKFVLLHSLNGKTPREAHSKRVLWQISITYFKEKYKIQHASLFSGEASKTSPSIFDVWVQRYSPKR